MSENTQNVKMKFAENIRSGNCVICGSKFPLDNLQNQFIEIPSKDQKGGFMYHEKCLPKVTIDFATALINCKTLDDINNMLNS